MAFFKADRWGRGITPEPIFRITRDRDRHLPINDATCRGRLGRPGVTVMKTAEMRNRCYGATTGWLDRSRNRRVLLQRQMGAAAVIVFKVSRQDPTQVVLIQHDDVIQTVSADGTQQSLAIGILPRRGGSNRHFLNAHVLNTGLEIGTEDLIPVSWSRCAVKGLLFQQVRVLSRQRSSRPGSYPNGCGGNEAFGAWEKEGGLGPSAIR